MASLFLHNNCNLQRENHNYDQNIQKTSSNLIENHQIAKFSVSLNGTKYNYRVPEFLKHQETEKKILSIKNDKVCNKPKVDHVDDSWHHLYDAVMAIQESRPLPKNLTQEDLYRYVDNLITQPHSQELLYTNLRDLIEKHIKSWLKQLLSVKCDYFGFSRLLNDCWIHHCQKMKMLCNIFVALDRGYVLKKNFSNVHVSSIWDMGLKLFRTHIFDAEEVKNRYLDDLDIMIEKELSGEIIDRSLVNRSHLLQKVLNMMLDQNRLHDLSLLYKLLTLIKGGCQDLCIHFNEYIKLIGKTIVTDLEKDKSMVQELLDFKDKMDAIVNTCFANNEKIMLTLKEAFEVVINLRQNKLSELMAKFVHEKLGVGNNDSTKNEMECILDKFIVLFRFIHGKYVFEAFYKECLAERLLVGGSAFVNAEKGMFNKLKHECGPVFTYNLEGMIKDMDHSNDTMLAFKQHLYNTHNGNIYLNLNVNIFPMGYLPNNRVMEIILPENMIHSQQFFNKFYLDNHSKRKLQWQPTLDYCVLTATFPRGTKELQVSLFQALVLLLFNDSDVLSLSHISSKTNIEDSELRRTLQSLSSSKTPFLLKTTTSKDINNNDKFTYNKDFTNQLFRITISQTQMKETCKEKHQTEEQIFRDRQYQIDAAIVRIMKMKKVLSHNLLISELNNQLKFTVKPSDFKQRIESLIDLDYIVRDKDSPKIYNYVA